MLQIPRTVIGAFGLAILTLCIVATPVVAGEQVNLPTPVSPNGKHLLDLYNLIMIPALIVFVGVEVGLLIIIFRFRRRRADQIPPQFHGSNTLEIVWTVIPFIIVLVIALLSGNVIFQDSINRPIGDASTTEVVVEGSRFSWDYTYPVTKPDGKPFTTHNILYVPTHRQVRLKLQSHDVIHSWWVPAITGKADAVPGYDNFTWMNIDNPPGPCPSQGPGGRPLVDADAAGQPVFSTPCHWHGECAELCGTGHADMQIDVVAIDDWDAWLHGQLAVAAPSPTAAASALRLGLIASPSASPSAYRAQP